MRTTNGLERLNKEIQRRTRVATLFPNSTSCLRLVSAILAEQGRGVDERKNLPEHETLAAPNP
jgi:transposase-like protein